MNSLLPASKTLSVPTIDGNKTHTVYYNPYAIPHSTFFDLEKVYKRGKHGYALYNIPCAFDIETTTIADTHWKEKKLRPIAFMYHWQFCFDRTVIFGRTWEQFQALLTFLKTTLQLSDNLRLPIYVHNLGYEFQYMHNFIEISDIFATQERKPLRVTGGGFEWRCSWKLSNMSLQKWCENSEGCTHYKLDGDKFDYNKIRTPSTPMTEYEEGYCFNDVYGLCECLRAAMQEDNLLTIPMTSTGYVRRDFKKAVLSNRHNAWLFKQSRMTAEEYLLCRECLSGGVTHANRYKADEIIEDVWSADYGSSYPFVMCTEKYPVGKWHKGMPRDYSELLSMCDRYACMMEIEFFYINLKSNHPVPYISLSKCKEHKDVVIDNGKIIAATYIKTCILSVDLDVIDKLYHYDSYNILRFYYARKDYLPLEYRQQLFHYFVPKTGLKGIDEKVYEYLKSKNKLNGAYGMIISDIVHAPITYNGVEWKTEQLTEKEIDEKLARYYSRHGNWLIYQQGVFVPAYARRNLYLLFDITGKDTVYGDTDSDKFVGKEHIDEIMKLNKMLMEKALSMDIVLQARTKDGQLSTAGQVEIDEHYARFKTLGAKKYAYDKLDKNGNMKFGITVSGMHKEKGAKSVGSLENFNLGETYHDIGRSTMFFNDTDEIFEITVNGDTFTTSSNVAAVDTTYTLGISDEYSDIITNSKTLNKVLTDAQLSANI